MNTNHLKKFAQSARRKLLSQVAAKLDYVLTHDTAELREQATVIKRLKTELERVGKEQLVEKISYIWFNRLMALRYMDANDYQPGGIRIVSARDGESLPEVLQEAKSGGLTDPEWKSKMSIVNDILDGKLNSKNPQNEAYRHLLVGACNQLSRQFPFLFERINDYAELLLPDDLTSEFSIVYDVVHGMSTEDCAEVEIIGWLYQFYISEKNEELIKSKKSYKKDELAPASQLFTPKWIVQYMVDNTLGQVWSEINPDTKVTSTLEFYIKPECTDKLEPREKKSIEDVKFFEPCVGSGHILSYAFDVFYKIYEEEGYSPAQIPELIIKKNLFGVDIDERAAQLASFVLLMKGRQKSRRFIQKIEKNRIIPNISYYQDFAFDNTFKNATALGSLIKVEPSEVNKVKIDENSIFASQQRKLQQLYKLLGQQYDVVVTNPPYISSSRMEGSLKQYVEANYPSAKSDLFSAFILRCLELVNKNGLTGYMTPFVWMFISSYEKLRLQIIDNHFINNLIQLEYSGFDGATVPICTFTLRNNQIEKGKGSYIKLSDFKGSETQAPKTLEAISNIDCGWFYCTYQEDFNKIPGSPIGYWLSEKSIRVFESERIDSIAKVGVGLQTGNNNRFIRTWFEVDNEKTMIVYSADNIDKTWHPINKGGDFRKWYGNHKDVILWGDNGDIVKSEKPKSVIRNESSYYKKCITWSRITSGFLSFRLLPVGFIHNDASCFIEPFDTDHTFAILSYLNSPLKKVIFEDLNPTLNLLPGQVNSSPIRLSNVNTVKFCITISKIEWNSRETSWGFLQNELIKTKAQDLQESIDLYQQYWTNKFYQLHSHEEELNKHFIEIYGLQEELIPDVPLSEITILRDELDQKKLKDISERYQSGWILKDQKEWVLPSKEDKPELPFDTKEIIAQFISYSVGCMMGRYSLDKNGLILANAGDSLEQYIEIVGKQITDLTFESDDDAIIPVLDDEWFEDDIVGRFFAFLKASFGERAFTKNLQYLEQQLGKDIRKYFVKDFYKDHIKRYKKRPIYWMFSSPKGYFRVLVYLHRYTPDTLNNILNDYLRDFIQKLEAQKQHYQQLQETGSASEQTKAIKEIDKLDKMIQDCQEYERDILYPLATERIAIDLDDGVLVNYNRFGKAVELVKGLNDAKAKKKVRGFDWIEVETIRD